MDKKFIISFGVSNIDSGEHHIIFAKDQSSAVFDAFQAACELYDNYAALHALRDIDQIIEEECVDNDEAEEIFNEERENWIEYSAKEWTEQNIKNIIDSGEDFHDFTN